MISSNCKSQLEVNFDPQKLTETPSKLEVAQTNALSNLIMLGICVRYLQCTACRLTATDLHVPDNLTFTVLFESIHRSSVGDSGHRHCMDILQGFGVTVILKKLQVRQYHVQKLDET